VYKSSKGNRTGAVNPTASISADCHRFARSLASIAQQVAKIKASIAASSKGSLIRDSQAGPAIKTTKTTRIAITTATPGQCSKRIAAAEVEKSGDIKPMPSMMRRF
jgi:hypothetical protein